MIKKKIIKFILISLLFLNSLYAKDVKVGFLTNKSDFMSGSALEQKYGYAYEYLQKIASYTGWKYEYVYGTFDELYASLLTGQIDILPDVIQADKQNEKILFPDYIMGTKNYYLYTKEKQIGLNTDNFLSDKVIGLKSNSYTYSLLFDYLKEKNLNCKVIQYPAKESVVDLFDDGKFDLLLESDILAEFQWNAICKIGSTDYYFGVNKQKPELLEELNNALAEIINTNPLYNNYLWNKYFEESISVKQLSEKEIEWLQNNKEINIGCLKDDVPFCYINEKTNETEGLVVDLMQVFRNIFGLNDVKINYKFYNSFASMQYAFNRKEIDVLFPLIYDVYTAEQYGVYITDPVTTLQMSYVCKDNKNPNFMKKVAVVEGGRDPYYLYKNYPETEVITFYSEEKCIDAVLNNEVDGAVFSIYKLQNIDFGKRHRYNLKTTGLPIFNEVCFASRDDNLEIISIFNKLLTTVTKIDINSSIENHVITYHKYSLNDFARDYSVIIVIYVLIIIITLFLLFFILSRMHEYVDYDVLTHLLNRRKLDSYMTKVIKKAEEQEEPFTILMFDLDNFKRINDTYGHACGDQVLKHIATTISRNIKEDDLAFRWGGEEFLVILKTDGMISKKIAERIRKSVEKQRIEYKDLTLNVTVTIGLSEYKKGSTAKSLFESADKKLYEGKQSGKNKVVF